VCQAAIVCFEDGQYLVTQYTDSGETHCIIINNKKRILQDLENSLNFCDFFTEKKSRVPEVASEV
jgi:hypothetical protein